MVQFALGEANPIFFGDEVLLAEVEGEVELVLEDLVPGIEEVFEVVAVFEVVLGLEVGDGEEEFGGEVGVSLLFCGFGLHHFGA